MKRELKNASGLIFLTIEFDAQNQWVYADWSGYQTRASIMQGANIYLEVLAECNCPYLLNNNSLVAGLWSQNTEWLINDWAPRAVAQGLTHFAHVISPESLARLSAENLQNKISSFFRMQIFEKPDQAKEWLQQVQRIIS